MKVFAILCILFSWSQVALSNDVRVVKRGGNQQNVVRIEVSDPEHFNDKDYRNYMRQSKYDYKGHRYANRKLRRRVRQLEMAVQQLQEEIFFLRDQRYSQANFACVLDAGTRGMYVGKAQTKVEAEALAFQKCSKRQGNFMCKGSPVKCEREI